MFFARNCIKCPEPYKEFMFANTSPHVAGSTSKSDFLRFSEMSRSTQESNFPNPQLHSSVGGNGGSQSTKMVARN